MKETTAKKVLNALNEGITRIEELTSKDDLSDIPHYQLEEAIIDVYDSLLYARITLKESL